MFRTTAFTGMVDLQPFRWINIQIDDAATSIFDKVQFVTISGNPVDIKGTDRWKTLAGARRRAQAIVNSDGRRTGTTVGMFVIDASQLTNKKGDTGRTMSTLEFIDYVLTWDDGEYRGETAADRKRDRDTIAAYLKIVS